MPTLIMFMQRYRQAEIVEKEILTQFPKVEAVKFDSSTGELRFTTTKDMYLDLVADKLRLRVGPVEVYIFKHNPPYDDEYGMHVHNIKRRWGSDSLDFVCHPHVYYGQACFSKLNFNKAMLSENYDAAVDIALRFLETSGASTYWSLEKLAEKSPERVERIAIEHKRGTS